MNTERLKLGFLGLDSSLRFFKAQIWIFDYGLWEFDQLWLQLQVALPKNRLDPQCLNNLLRNLSSQPFPIPNCNIIQTKNAIFCNCKYKHKSKRLRRVGSNCPIAILYKPKIREQLNKPKNPAPIEPPPPTHQTPQTQNQPNRTTQPNRKIHTPNTNQSTADSIKPPPDSSIHPHTHTPERGERKKSSAVHVRDDERERGLVLGVFETPRERERETVLCESEKETGLRNRKGN